MSESICPDRLYRVEHVAAFLDVKPKTVYAIGRHLLPVVHVGAGKNGAVRYWGRDVLAYLNARRDDGGRRAA